MIDEAARAASFVFVMLTRVKAGAWLEIARPFSFTASIVPVLVGAALTVRDGAFDPWLFLATLVASVSLQAGTNVVNEIHDVRTGVDTRESPRASRALVEGRVSLGEARALGVVFFAITIAVGLWLVTLRGVPLLLIGLAGVLGGYFYTAPPFQYKYRALGVPLVFVYMGVLMVVGAYYAIAGRWSDEALFASLPIGILVAAILHANDVRDVDEDSRAGFRTLSILLTRRTAASLYVWMMLGAFGLTALLVVVGRLPLFAVVALLALPPALRATRLMGEAMTTGDVGVIARIDQRTAQVHLLFGLLLATGIAAAALSISAAR